MEPVAHSDLFEKMRKILRLLLLGQITFEINELNKTLEIKQNLMFL